MTRDHHGAGYAYSPSQIATWAMWATSTSGNDLVAVAPVVGAVGAGDGAPVGAPADADAALVVAAVVVAAPVLPRPMDDQKLNANCDCC